MSSKSERRYWLGIDPDTKGGMALVNSSREVILIPFGPRARDVLEAFVTLESLGVYGLNSPNGVFHSGIVDKAALECQHPIPIMSRKSCWTCGRFLGWVEMLLEEGCIPTDRVLPQTWQRYFRAPRGLKGKARKHWLYEKARALYPQVELNVSQADALLLAEWAMAGRMHG